MKWIGQHIYDLVAKFRNDVIIEDLDGSSVTIIPGSLNPLEIFQPVNDASPRIDLGASSTEKLNIRSFYASGTQTLQSVIFSTSTESSIVNYGLYRFKVDGTSILDIDDGGINLDINMGISINGTDILTDSSGTATLSNIDAIDATTVATFEAALTDSTTDSLVIDTDRSADQGEAGAENITALHVDFDRTVPTGGTYAHRDVGIDLDVTSAGLGSHSVKGMDIDIVGTTDGTSTATGIDLNVSGADTNNGIHVLCDGEQLRLSHNVADYATFTVADTGDLTITTVGDGTTDSDLLLKADGKIDLQPADGKATNILSTETSAAGAGSVLNLQSNDGAALGDDHRLGRLGFQAAEDAGGTFRQGASIEAYADAAWSDTVNDTRLEFYTMDGNNTSELSLTLDSDLLATFAGGVTVTGNLTMGSTAALNNTGEIQVATQPNIESIGTDGDTLNILGDTISAYNTTTNMPVLKMVNQTDDATGPRINLQNQRYDGGIQAGEADDVLGNIGFWGYDDQGTPGDEQYAKIYADIHDATSGEESGRLYLQVANHDGGLGSGLILTGGSADNEIDVTLGLGANSVVTVPGDITVAGDITGTLATATQPAIESIGTDGDTLSILSDTLLMSNTSADTPVIKLVNTTDDDQASQLIFEKLRDDDAVAQGQNLGEIWFRGQDSAQNAEDYAYIIGEIDVSTSGQESGELQFGVASHDGSTRTAMRLTGGSEASEVDATIGLGANSVVTIPGTLDGNVSATQPLIDSIGTDGDTLSILSDTIQMSNTTASKPEILLNNQADDATGPAIYLKNQRVGVGVQDGEDNDVLGTIYFVGYDDGTPTLQTYAGISANIHDATSGEESGRLTFQVANHDGGLGSGLILTGGGADNQIDVVIGLGAASNTYILGNIDIGGTCNIAASHNYTIDDTVIISDSSGTATLSNIDALDATTATTIETALEATTKQFTYHMFKDNIATTKHYVGLQEADGEAESVNKNLPFTAPFAGKLLKVFLRATADLSGDTLTWRLETLAAGATTGSAPTIVGTQSGAGCSGSSMTTYDFTSSLDSGDNIIDAGDMAHLSIQSDSSSSNLVYNITCLWEWDLS